MSYQSTLGTIDSIMDDAAKSAAEVFLTDARKNLAPFNLSRHRIQFELSDVVLHERRADDQAKTCYWFEARRGIRNVGLAVWALGDTHNKLPESVRRHLAGKFLEIP